MRRPGEVWRREWLWDGKHFCYLLNPRVCSSFFRNMMDKPVWDTGLPVFTFVRHPWDRLISALSLIGGRLPLWERYQRNEGDLHLHPQSWFLSKWPVDFMGRYEHLERDYAALQSTFGHNLPPLRVVHQSKSRSKWEDVDFPWDRVYERYASDFELGYSC